MEKYCAIDHIGNRLYLVATANGVHRLNYTIYRSIVAVLGETNWVRSFGTGLISSGLIWYLVDNVLGIYLVALPTFIGTSP